MPLSKGDILQNRYRITSLLAQGGMACIYRGWHTTLNIPIAIKEMLPQPGLDAQTLTSIRDQFKKEAGILAQLEHPSLVDVLDFFEEGDNAYLIMDLIEGESLADMIERERSLPERVVWKWAKRLLNALEYCHDHDVIHRDIKIYQDGFAVGRDDDIRWFDISVDDVVIVAVLQGVQQTFGKFRKQAIG